MVPALGIVATYHSSPYRGASAPLLNPMPKPNHAITQTGPQPLSQPVKPGSVTIDGQRYQVHLVIPQPQPITQQDRRPTHYQTAKSRGVPTPPVSLPKLPTTLTLTLSAVIALSFLVAASMFSIALTAYSNSVDRIDQSRSFLHVE